MTSRHITAITAMCLLTFLFFTALVRSCVVENHANTTERIKAVCAADLMHDSARSAACILALKNTEGEN